MTFNILDHTEDLEDLVLHLPYLLGPGHDQAIETFHNRYFWTWPNLNWGARVCAIKGLISICGGDHESI